MGGARQPPSDRERGFNLVEVAVALAIVAWATASLSGLFLVGASRVSRAGVETEALAVLTWVADDLQRLSSSQTYRSFGKTETDGAFTVDSRTDPFAASWQEAIDAALADGWATLTVTPLTSAGTTAATFGDARTVRVEVLLEWIEIGRQRRLRVVFVRL